MDSAGDRGLRVLILTGGLLVVSAWSANGALLTLKDLLDQADQYHQQVVSVTGEASELSTRIGPRNLPFYSFVLKRGTKSVTVVMQGKPELSNGDHVLVHGIFFKSRKAGRTTITNRIEATLVQQLHNVRDPLVG